MSVARDRAMSLRTIYGVEGVIADHVLDEMLADRSIPVITSSREEMGPLRELLKCGRLYLRDGQSREWLRWLKAEGLCHWRDHEGNQRALHRMAVGLQERQAHEGAGYLVYGDPAATFDYPRCLTVRGVARLARVPEECVGEWWRIVSSELGYTESYRRARESAWWRTPVQRMAWGR